MLPSHMNKNEEILSEELISAVKDAVEAAIGVKFAEISRRYFNKNWEQRDLTVADLVAEILEAGDYQKEDDASFEDAVMIGAFALCEDLFDEDSDPFPFSFPD